MVWVDLWFWKSELYGVFSLVVVLFIVRIAVLVSFVFCLYLMNMSLISLIILLSGRSLFRKVRCCLRLVMNLNCFMLFVLVWLKVILLLSKVMSKLLVFI